MPSRYQLRYREAVEDGCCYRCLKMPAAEGHNACATCRVRYHEQRQARIQAGMCSQCRALPRTTGRRLCQRCCTTSQLTSRGYYRRNHGGLVRALMCGNCGEPGHNRRTCLHEAKGTP